DTERGGGKVLCSWKSERFLGMNPVFRQRKECTVPSGTAIPGRCVERTVQAPLRYRVYGWSGRSKPLFRLPVPKIHLIYSPRVEDVSDIKLIRTDTTLDLSQKAEKRYPTTALRRARRSGPRRAQPWWAGAEEGGKRGTCSV